MKSYKPLILLLVLFCIFFLTPVLSFAGYKWYVDQYQLDDIDEYVEINSTQMIAQTFKPDYNGVVPSIRFKINKISGITSDNTAVPPGDLIVEIRSTINNLVPSDEILASSRLSELIFEEDNPQWYDISLPNWPFLEKKQTYALVLRIAEDTPDVIDGIPGYYTLYYNGDAAIDPYPAGMLMGKKPDRPYTDWIVWFRWYYMDAAFAIQMTRGNNF